VDWRSGRTKSSASFEGGHPSPSRSSSREVPPLFAKARGGGEACSLFEPPPCEPVDAFDISLSFVLFSPLLPFGPWLCGGEVGLLWIGVREGRKAVRVSGVATLVLLDRRPLQFPPFCEGHGVGEACSLFEASPCEPRLISLLLSCLFSSLLAFRPLSFTEKRWDCCGLAFRKD